MQVKEKKEPERLKKRAVSLADDFIYRCFNGGRHLFPAFGKTGRIRNGAEGSGPKAAGQLAELV